MTRRRGRPPGSRNTAQELLGAARAVFAERGYEAASIRTIASRAGVDPAMVRHFFGTKEKLFAASMKVPFDPSEVVVRLLADGLDDIGTRIVLTFLSMWDSAEAGSLIFQAFLRSATSSKQSTAMLREYVTSTVLGPLADAVEKPDSHTRVTLVASQLVGVGMARYVLELEPLASADRKTVARWVGPTLQHYLFGTLP